MIPKAEESNQIKKARRKLEKQLADESKKINDKALEQMKKAMQIWIERRQNQRVKLQERLELFDENRHSVKVKSKFVTQLMHRLQEESGSAKKSLTGRIKQE